MGRTVRPFSPPSRDEYDPQGMLARHAWLAPATAPWQDQSFKYNDAGLLTMITDDAAPARGRRYEYDQLVRLTCEIAGDPTTSGACTTTNPAVLGRFTYSGGEAANPRRQGLLRQKATFLGRNAFAPCIASLLAHEALHPALLSLRADELHAPQRYGWSEAFLAGAALADSNKLDRSTRGAGAVDHDYPSSIFPFDENGAPYRQLDEGYVRDAVERCIPCESN